MTALSCNFHQLLASLVLLVGIHLALLGGALVKYVHRLDVVPFGARHILYSRALCRCLDSASIRAHRLIFPMLSASRSDQIPVSLEGHKMGLSHRVKANCSLKQSCLGTEKAHLACSVPGAVLRRFVLLFCGFRHHHVSCLFVKHPLRAHWMLHK